MYSFSIDRSRWTECESNRVRYPASLCWCLRFSFIQNSMLFNATEYHLESPLWKYIVVHMHQGGYEDLKRVGDDNYYHIYIPYMFSEKDLIPFLRSNLDHFKQIYDSANDLKRISQLIVFVTPIIALLVCILFWILFYQFEEDYMNPGWNLLRTFPQSQRTVSRTIILIYQKEGISPLKRTLYLHPSIACSELAIPS